MEDDRLKGVIDEELIGHTARVLRYYEITPEMFMRDTESVPGWTESLRLRVCVRLSEAWDGRTSEGEIP